MLTRLALFIVTSIVLLAIYELGFHEVASRFPSAIPSFAPWLTLQVAVPLLLGIGLAQFFGIWRRNSGLFVKLVAGTWCMGMPLIVAREYMSLACALFRDCL